MRTPTIRSPQFIETARLGLPNPSWPGRREFQLRNVSYPVVYCTIDSQRLEQAPRAIYAGFPPSPRVWVGGTCRIPTFCQLLRLWFHVLYEPESHYIGDSEPELYAGLNNYQYSNPTFQRDMAVAVNWGPFKGA